MQISSMFPLVSLNLQQTMALYTNQGYLKTSDHKMRKAQRQNYKPIRTHYNIHLYTCWLQLPNQVTRLWQEL